MADERELDNFKDHTESSAETIEEVTQALQQRLGQRLVAYIVGITDGRDIGRYGRGEETPHSSTERKLRSVLELMNTILKDENDRMTRLWFQGYNSELNGEAPAKALHDSFEQHFSAVKLAALKFTDLSR
jgi:hypothetical protein